MEAVSLKTLLAIAAPYRFALLGATGLLLLESGMLLTLPWLGGQFADNLLSQQSAKPPTMIVAALLAVLVLQAIVRASIARLAGRCEHAMLADLSERIYDRLQAMPLEFHHQSSRGDLLALLGHDAEHISHFIASTLLAVGPLIVTVLGAIILMHRIDPVLSLGIAVLVPVVILLLKIFGRYVRPLSRELSEAYAEKSAIAEENLGLIPAIKSFVRESTESQRFSSRVRRYELVASHQHRLSAVLEPVAHLLASSSVVLLLWAGSETLHAGGMGPAQLVSILLYAGVLARPISALASLYGQTQRVQGGLERINRVFASLPEDLSRADAPDLPPATGAISFRDVVFAYPGRDAILQGLTLEIRPGEKLALTGRNGSGKSTIAHLLLQFYVPQSGKILIDGYDISSVTLRSLRRQIGLVPQHVALFNASISDNIAFGKSGSSQSEIEAAAVAAQAHAFISALPQGYATIVGDQGLRLSGGQRQRLALARALLKNPPILVFDEATAMFDPESENSFVAECSRVLSGRTVIIITHRPASLALADRIVILDNGRITSDKMTTQLRASP